MKWLLRPIPLIIKATDEVKKGNLNISPISHCDRRDEIGALAASFNSMIKQLVESQQMQKDFINIAAHELHPNTANSWVVCYNTRRNIETRKTIANGAGRSC